MQRPVSLALRLTILFGIVSTIVFPVFGWILSQSMEEHFRAGDTSELENIAHAVPQVLSEIDPQREPGRLQQRFDDILVGHHHASLRIMATDGQLVYASPGPDLSGIITDRKKVPEDKVQPWVDVDHTYRVLVRQVDANGHFPGHFYILAVAVPIDYHLRFLKSFRRTLWLMIVTSILVMSLMGWIAVRQGHAPLRDIVARIRRISASELSSRLNPEAMPAELADLAVSFNDMLQRVDTSFKRLSDFNADIAHELRTPLTNLMTQSQVALSQARSIDEYREILYSNMEEYERMAQMIGDMLFLAKADNGLRQASLVSVDLAEEVHTLFDYYDLLAEEKGVHLALEGQARLEGDQMMLRRGLGNLVSNAIRHTPENHTVTVRLHQYDNGDVSGEVVNPGKEIPARHLDRLFDRFYRVDPSRQRNEEGAGLGLAIVKSIVEAHGGEIWAVSSPESTSFCFRLPGRQTAADGEGPGSASR